MNSMELFVSLRYLRGKRKIGTYITAIGVFLGSFVLIIALSIANGFEKEVRDRIVGTLAHAKIFQYHSMEIENPDSLREIILQQPGVVAAAPYITGKGGIEHEQVQEGVLIMGVDDSLEQTVTDLHAKIKHGAFELGTRVSNRDRSFPGIVIGLGLADKMGVRQGSEAVLMSLSTPEGSSDPVPKMMRFTVAGIFETGMYEYDLNLVYISIASARELFDMQGVEGIQIKTTDLFKAAKIVENIRNELGNYPFRVLDWESQNKSLFQWMKLERLIIYIVISLIMLVAALNIVSSLITMTFEKRREIGILMSMGAHSSSILKIFVIYGIVVGFVGSTVGVSLGVTLCAIQYHWRLIPLPGDIYFIDTLPVIIRGFDVGLVYVSANLISWLTTLYPAYKASKMLPAESIRYE
ncbi:MAG: ABC transporter permease [Chitinispirillaceae bacterium]|nr:ABC transporter permease [Chitinispirillaceae bacterium]